MKTEVSSAKSNKKKEIKGFVIFIVLMAIIGVVTYLFSRDDLTYAVITNCEENIKKQLVSPRSFSFSSAYVSESQLDPRDYNYLTEFSKDLVYKGGFDARKLFVKVDFYSKNRMNAEIKSEAYCTYTMISKDGMNSDPSLVSVAIGNNVISSITDDFEWILNSVSMASTKKASILMNKLKLFGKDIKKNRSKIIR